MLRRLWQAILSAALSVSPTNRNGSDTLREISTQAELDTCLEESSQNPLLIFKHSTACPISGRASLQVAKYTESAGEDGAAVVMVKVIESRALSNALATQLGVPHQSPQILLVRNGKSVWTTSHHQITPDSIRGALESHAD